MSLPTVRIPELAVLTDGLPLDLADQIPIYIASEDKTKRVTLQTLNTFFNTGGGGGSHAPVVYGGRMIYVVPSSAAGTDTASIPSISGQDFTLDRAGFPMEPLLPDDSNAATAEYQVLDAGGFKLLNGGILGLNERYTLTLFGLIGGGGTGGGTTTYASFIKGKKSVSVNTTLDPVSDINKIIQIRGAATSLTQTLPSVGDMAANSLIILESIIGNTKPQKISTSGGQYIYLNNEQKTEIWLHPGETVWLFRDDDGFYVINDGFGEKYRNVCIPKPLYKVGLNQVAWVGQLANRADYPRVWEFANSIGSSLVNEATWATTTVTVNGRNVEKPYRGCFSTGDGSTTFRFPDLRNLGVRGLLGLTGTDTNRHLNKPGGYQDDAYETHSHSLQYYRNDAQGGGQQYVYYLENDNGPTILPDGAYLTKESGNSPETRMENFGAYWGSDI